VLRLAIRFLGAVLALTAFTRIAQAQPVYHQGSTRKLMQLTGDYDRTLRKATTTLTQSSAGVRNTDLGSGFWHKGKLWFAFGDTWGRAGVRDFLAASNVQAAWPRVSDLMTLNIRKDPDGLFEFTNVPGISHAEFEVPTHAIGIGNQLWMVHTTDHSPSWAMGRSVMALSNDDGNSWTNLYTLSSQVNGGDFTNAHFINVSMRLVNAADYPNLLPWSSGDVVLIWGTGSYTNSGVYLAAVPASGIGTKSNLRYIAGVDQGNGPIWSTSEAAARPLFTHPAMRGEISVGWLKSQRRWIVMYLEASGDATRGIHFRTATKPWGPWTSTRQILEPTADEAYARYMNVPGLDRWDDWGDDRYGGEYAPYFLWDTGDSTVTQIFWTMSTWNPYQTVVMQTEIGLPEQLPATSAPMLFPMMSSGWSRSSSSFYQARSVAGKPGITTWTNQGDAATGWMWRWLPRDQWNKALSFSVSDGSGGEVILLEGGGDIPTSGNAATIYSDIKRGVYGNVVQCTWGLDSNTVERAVTWNLRRFDRANLKIVVIDHRTEPGWNFVAVSDMTLTRNEPEGEVLGQAVAPGSLWHRTAGSWYSDFALNGVHHVTTFASAGDANQGVMWTMLPRDWANKRLNFSVHGGHARVLLLEGGEPIPTNGTFTAIQSDLLNGRYGRVLESVRANDSNTQIVPVEWQLTKYKSDDLKIAIVDADTGPWGFISVSDMSLYRFP
jgi:hypothetical protein